MVVGKNQPNPTRWNLELRLYAKVPGADSSPFRRGIRLASRGSESNRPVRRAFSARRVVLCFACRGASPSGRRSHDHDLSTVEFGTAGWARAASGESLAVSRQLRAAASGLSRGIVMVLGGLNGRGQHLLGSLPIAGLVQCGSHARWPRVILVLSGAFRRRVTWATGLVRWVTLAAATGGSAAGGGQAEAPLRSSGARQ